MQWTGPFADTVVAAFQAARGFALRLRRTKRQIDLFKAGFPGLNRQFIRFTTRRRRLHLLTFSDDMWNKIGSAGMPWLAFQTCGTQPARF